MHHSPSLIKKALLIFYQYEFVSLYVILPSLCISSTNNDRATPRHATNLAVNHLNQSASKSITTSQLVTYSQMGIFYTGQSSSYHTRLPSPPPNTSPSTILVLFFFVLTFISFHRFYSLRLQKRHLHGQMRVYSYIRACWLEERGWKRGEKFNRGVGCGPVSPPPYLSTILHPYPYLPPKPPTAFHWAGFYYIHI